jgi:hypothetical protein
VNKKLFFSLEGVDLNDDDEAFAHLIGAKANPGDLLRLDARALLLDQEP